MGVLFLYINAAFGLLSTFSIALGSIVVFGATFIFYLLHAFGLLSVASQLPLAGSPIASVYSAFILNLGRFLLVVLSFAHGLSGMGIANEKKWGYIAGITLVAFDAAGLFILIFEGAISQMGGLNVILGVIWVAVLLALLIHKESRQYYKIWFRK